jgi:hypothetical protein
MTDLTAPTETDTLYCANHPTVATSLRCNKCGKLICPRCAVRTPVGYRCRDCVRGQQQIFETALWYDYVIAAVLALPLGAFSSALLGSLGFFVILLAPIAGGVTAEIVRVAVRRRRGRRLPLVATAAFVLGCLGVIALPWLFVLYAMLLGAPMEGVGGLGFRALLPLIFTVLASGTLYTRLRGIAI